MLRTEWFVLLCALALLLAAGASSQTGTGTVTGIVVDPSGAVVPQAQVTLIQESTTEKRSAVTDEAGEFVFAAIRPGTYTLQVEKAGLQTFRRTGLVVAIAQRLAVGNLKLNVQQAAESLTISAEAPPINTENADTAPTLTAAHLQSIPVQGRDVMNLLRVLPGVSSLSTVPWGEIGQNDPAGPASNGGQFGSFTPNVGGSRLFWNTVTVDGQVGSNPDFPGLFMAAISMDAVSEAKIISHNYTAEYGRNPGPTISLATKSGARFPRRGVRLQAPRDVQRQRLFQ